MEKGSHEPNRLKPRTCVLDSMFFGDYQRIEARRIVFLLISGSARPALLVKRSRGPGVLYLNDFTFRHLEDESCRTDDVPKSTGWRRCLLIFWR